MSQPGSKTGSAAAVAAVLLLAALAAATAQQAPQLGRSIHGTVLNALNQPIPSAIVYLKSAQSKVVHTVITDEHGAYAFHQLKAGVSYQVYAEWQGHRSKVRVDSQYITRNDLRLDLQIPVG